MQAIAIFSLLLLIAGALMAQEPKCEVPPEALELGLKCVNETLGGNLNLTALFVDKNYLTPEEKEASCDCVVKAKKFETSEGKLDCEEMREDLNKTLMADDETKKHLDSELNRCCKLHENSKLKCSETTDCFYESAVKACEPETL